MDWKIYAFQWEILNFESIVNSAYTVEILA